ncbi:MAG TPA: DUF1294 domain-containing protein [Arenimonas sp.]|nr:DUF1294 domain-containing protein [Arenimonas sp.]
MIALFFAVINLVTFLAYYFDKNAAIHHRQRTSEATLHTLGVLGGWPAGFLAQQLFRHKTNKIKFQVQFWLSALINVFIIVWRMTI